MQAALDNWAAVEPLLRALSNRLDLDEAVGAEPFDIAQCAAPLPRAYQFADGSAFLSHMELVRRARGAEMPESFRTDPLIYQGLSDGFLGPRDDILLADADWGIDFEAEIAVVLDDVPMGVTAAEAARHIKLVMLCNDVSLRNLVPGEVAKGFGFYQSKPASAFSPVAVTPDALGEAWDGARLHRPLVSQVNGREIGHPERRRRHDLRLSGADRRMPRARAASARARSSAPARSRTRTTAPSAPPASPRCARSRPSSMARRRRPSCSSATWCASRCSARPARRSSAPSSSGSRKTADAAGGDPTAGTHSGGTFAQQR